MGTSRMTFGGEDGMVGYDLCPDDYEPGGDDPRDFRQLENIPQSAMINVPFASPLAEEIITKA